MLSTTHSSSQQLPPPPPPPPPEEEEERPRPRRRHDLQALEPVCFNNFSHARGGEVVWGSRMLAVSLVLHHHLL
jgi:hypothetical protein